MINKKNKLNNNSEFNKEFTTDIKNFFSGRKCGHIGTWRYSEPSYKGDVVNGMRHWAEFLKKAKNGGDYYAYDDEIKAIKSSLKLLEEHLPNEVTLIDLGPGSEEAVIEKSGYYINNLSNIKSYVGIDIVPEILDRTKIVIKDNYNNLPFYSATGDFYKDSLTFPVHGTPLMAMFGQTIFNLPIDPKDKELARKTMIGRLSKMRSHLCEGGFFLVTQDTNQDTDSLYKAYMTEDLFDLNLLHRIKRDLPISEGFNPEFFSFDPHFISETGAAAHTYICDEDMSFTLDGEFISLYKNQRLFMHNTYKFKSDYFIEMAQEAGFKSIFKQEVSKGRGALHLLRAV